MEELKKTEGLSFELALYELKSGSKLARKGWNGTEMFAVLSPGAKELPAEKFFNKDLEAFANSIGGKMDIRPAFMLKTAQNDVAYWIPSGSDLLAEDWCIVD
jgi:hypothetical protein